MELLIDQLSKQYKNGVWGLHPSTLTVGAGVLGLVGPPGAGKTTLMRMLATVMPPTGGTIFWQGEDIVRHPQAARRALGYLPQFFGLYPRLSGSAFLRYVAALKGVGRRRVEHVLELVELSGLATQNMGAYSGEARRRIGLAQALLNDPHLLLVDEPGAALEGEERLRLCALLGKVADGRLVVVATDQIDDVGAAAAQIALLVGGRLVPLGGGGRVALRPSELLRTVQGKVWAAQVDPDSLVEIKRQYVISHTDRGAGQTRLRIVSATQPHTDAVQVAPALIDAYAHYVLGGGAASEPGGKKMEGP